MDKNDDGASEVIGVILLIAITIILVAIAVSVIFDYSKGLKQPGLILISEHRLNDMTISITNDGGDVELLDPTAASPFTIKINDTVTTADSGDLNAAIGSSASFHATAGQHMVITALYKDGSTKIVYDGKV